MSFYNLLAPPEFAACVVEGGGQLIEKRTDGKATRFILIPDENARNEFLTHVSDDGRAKKYTKYLKNLQWARDTLWCDSRMQQYLLSPDPDLWPAVETIQSAAEVVGTLKETEDDDAPGAQALRRACAILQQELRFVGLHTLQEVPFVGKLTPYVVQAQPKKVLTREDHIPLASTALRVQLDERTYAVPDILTMRFVPSALKTLSSLAPLPTGTTDPQRVWTELVELHRRSFAQQGAGLFLSVKDVLRTFHWTEMETVGLMQHGASAGARVRLLSGILATVVHWTEATIVFVRRSTVDITPEEAFAMQPYASASVIRVNASSQEDMDAFVSRAFVSPLAKADSMHRERVQVSEYVTVVHVKGARNPFIVVHGNKVLGGFEGQTDVLSTYKRQREDHIENEMKEKAWQTVARTDKGASKMATSAGDNGGPELSHEQLVEEVRKSVLACLASGPMAKKQLVSQRQFSAFRNHPSFEKVLKDALKTCGEYKGNKYQLKE